MIFALRESTPILVEGGGGGGIYHNKSCIFIQ